jgi:hypothetical protein
MRAAAHTSNGSLIGRGSRPPRSGAAIAELHEDAKQLERRVARRGVMIGDRAPRNAPGRLAVEPPDVRR